MCVYRRIIGCGGGAVCCCHGASPSPRSRHPFPRGEKILLYSWVVSASRLQGYPLSYAPQLTHEPLKLPPPPPVLHLTNRPLRHLPMMDVSSDISSLFDQDSKLSGTCWPRRSPRTRSGLHASWEEWWTYDGISGPDFWGLINPNWNMCDRGRRQSPINIEPDNLVYDPHLRHVHIDKHRVSGTLFNTGQSVIFKVEKGNKHHVNITGGPLVYKYRFEDLYIHFGDANGKGSEHQIAGNTFPAEIQLYGFNVDLYRNMSEARLGSNGIVGLSIMIQVGDNGNDEIRILSSGFGKVTYRGQKWAIRHLSLAGLLPSTHHYMTYDGSTTHPGCWETTTWLIMNKPIYIIKQELYALRQLMQGDAQLPKAKMANNYRPVKALHHRTVRTNIDFTNAHRTKACPTMHREMFYAARQWPKL